MSHSIFGQYLYVGVETIWIRIRSQQGGWFWNNLDPHSHFNDLGSDEFQDLEVGSGQEILQRMVMIEETVEAVDGGGDFSFEKMKMGLFD